MNNGQKIPQRFLTEYCCYYYNFRYRFFISPNKNAYNIGFRLAHDANDDLINK
jgi:hypothetical protein